ncbi:MAG TPA: molybdate ABC transporter substrate-binding protein [Thermoanaerobaculia bacterium]|jgi:molybdate transport system substrate-binding protein
MRRVLCGVLLLLGCGSPASETPEAGELQVFAAVSLTDALLEIAAGYEKAGGDKVLLNTGASSFLARQIQEGAPADLFLSAGEAAMDQLERSGLVLQGARRSVLSNTLAIVVPSGSSLRIASPRDLAGPQVRALALAEPGSVPAGIYAREYLQSKGLWNAVAGKVVPTESVRAALAAVESGNVDAGIVYRTDAGTSKKVRIAYEVPGAEGPKISYPFAVLAGSERRDAARRFLAWLESPPALEVFRRHGFLVVAGPAAGGLP